MCDENDVMSMSSTSEYNNQHLLMAYIIQINIPQSFFQIEIIATI